jgi:hypothetical protein
VETHGQSATIWWGIRKVAVTPLARLPEWYDALRTQCRSQGIWDVHFADTDGHVFA